MTEHAVAVVGTGASPGGSDDPESGYAMGYRHADAYAARADCDVVACADVVPEHAERFAEAFGVDPDHAFGDHEAMLDEAGPDVVSVCVPPAGHADVVVDCARAGVDAVHCEKPMADTWGAARRMVQECRRCGVQLTFNHQLRCSEPVRRAKALLDDGAVGDLERVEASRGDLLQAGTHQLDLCSYFAGDVPASWVLGAVDHREERVWYGMHAEGQALALWEYENGVHGLASTGEGADAIGGTNRLLGSEGEMEVRMGEPSLRVRRDGEGWETVECAYEGDRAQRRAIDEVVESLDADEEPTLSGRTALIATAVAFGCWGSARRRGRVDLPLTIEDNPLAALAEAGAFANGGAGS